MTIAFLDPYLNSIGPCYEYDVTIVNEMEKRGVKCLLFSDASSNQDIITTASAIPMLTGKTSILPHKIIAEVAELKRVYKKIPDGSYLFIPNIFSGKSLFIYSLSLLFTSSKKFKKVIYLYRFIDRHKKQLFFYKLSNWVFKLSGAKIEPVADSEIVSETGQKYFSQKIDVLPIPHVWDMNNYNSLSTKEESQDLINIYLPGEARIDKGIITILAAVEQLINENKFKQYQLTVQFNPKSLNEQLTQIKEQLERLSKQCKLTVLSTLTTEEYYTQLKKADIVLITYISKNTNGLEGYHSRTSGVFSEAIAAAKPVITTKGTWMSLQMDKNYGSGICITDNSVTELADAIVQIGNNLNEYKQGAQKNAVQWAAIHNANSFCDKFIELCNR